MEIVAFGPLLVGSVVWQPAPRAFALTFVCKATFTLAPGEATLASTQVPPGVGDVHMNKDPSHSLATSTDLAPMKQRAEVLLVGSAYAPHGEPVRSLVARLCVADVDKSIEVFSDRSFSQDGTPMEGPRFTRMPLWWELAAGGPGTANPVGRRAEHKDAYGWTPIANLRAVGQPVHWNGAPLLPVGFGPIAPSWPARRDLLGPRAGAWPPLRWMDEPLPAGIDAAYFNAAPRDQQLDLLRDDEPIFLENLHPLHPQLTTALPGLHPRARLERPGAAEEDVPLRADTLLIDTDRSLCTVTWRGCVGLDHPSDPGRITVDVAPPRKRGSPIKPSASLVTLMPNQIDAAMRLPFVTAPPEQSPMSRPQAPVERPIERPSGPLGLGLDRTMDEVPGARGVEPVAPSDLAPWISPPASARPPLVAAEPFHGPGVAEGGVLAASDLAAASEQRPALAPTLEERPAPERPSTEQPRPRVAPPEAMKLVWFDPAQLP
ncbi:MAG: DUF2169 domain-containing protein, partial [Minicystis sp.]